MRLTHLKLAGFKSFVDPTTIHLHGQRVGVVGPNGCGKSNVMESVRWVLGESSAKEMRADAMDAVIFNGSANRKPISRASVELVFDNSMGGASGEWNQYAEISVKRVIERDKGSTYFINNTAVRRRDVADLFLGTGLGGRAYAIIGQNTISRIVEAKPEELRIFLEEAAGISKYKERRKETEYRLRDTRENLTRVEDICKELQKQINKLESQAVIAEKYHQLQRSLKLAEGQLWWLKKRDAALQWEASKQAVDQLINRLEAQMAELRASESLLETTRQAHYQASEGINQAQAAYYEANAEVSNLENQVQQNQDARERMRIQLEQVQQALIKNTEQLVQLETHLAEQQQSLLETEKQLADSTAELALLTTDLPEKDKLLKNASEEARVAEQQLAQTRQRVQIEHNNLHHLRQNREEQKARLTRLQDELTRLALPNKNELETLEQQLVSLQTLLNQQEQKLLKLSEEEKNLTTALQPLRQNHQQAQRELHQTQTEIQTLQKMQHSISHASHLSDWLNRFGLSDKSRLWQIIQVDNEWQQALESVLGERINALLAGASHTAERPPAGMVLGIHGQHQPIAIKHKNLTPLLDKVLIKQSDWSGVIHDWLHGVYLIDQDSQIESLRGQLAHGEYLVNRQGDVFTKFSITFHGASSGIQGVLERQQHLEALQQNVKLLQNILAQAQQDLNQCENNLQTIREQQQVEQQILRQITTDRHSLQLQYSKLKQAQEMVLQREQSIQQDRIRTEEKLTQYDNTLKEKQLAINQLESDLPKLQEQVDTLVHARRHAESAYYALRDDIQAVERKHQEHVFNNKIIINKINELSDKVKVNSQEKYTLNLRQQEAVNTLERIQMETLKANLVAAIERKQQAEQRLAQARNYLAEQEQILQTQERARLTHEQQLHPIRDALEQARLNEQQARIQFEQCQSGLMETGLDESVLQTDLDENAKTSALLDKTIKLQRDIDALGAVNLAAIQELANEKERKQYLDQQMQDLSTASQTLEEAIRKIDRETRGKLQATFDEANRNFNELFNLLFSGGQAKLEMLGEEILDTGIQVFAQPPGKKNTTIQLLSGGEKALTAMALVFALFRLNPAPFCLMDEVDAPLDDSNTERFCNLVKKMSEKTQFLFVSHNKITMEIAQQLIGVTMQESGVSRIVDVDIEAAIQMHTA